jgi:translation elongation factor EF-1beta
MSTEEKLRELGDPSGKQDANYWNEWFQVMCGDDHRSFEWYTIPSEVARVLESCKYPSGENSRMIHPGSGNSMVPVKLRDSFLFPHQHVVVDIADVALQQMKEVHDKDSCGENEISYIHGNVLDPPLPLDKDTFDVWVDKGLIDALFNDLDSSNTAQCQTLFDEAHRLLKPTIGVLLVVTMAEDHSLSLILHNWYRLIKGSMNLAWQPDMHIHEMEPTSGDMRPFGIMLTKASPSFRTETSELSIIWHYFDGSTRRHLVVGEAFDTAKVFCEESRQRFRIKVKKCNENKVLATIEVKPWDADVELYEVGQLIIGMDWMLPEGRHIRPNWQEYDNQTGGKAFIKIVPVGYGISKLILKCVIDSDDLDDFTQCLRDWDGGGIADQGIQSVDVNWEQTFRIVDMSSLASTNSKR